MVRWTTNRLFGGDGDDTIKGGASSDVIDGGDGVDIIEATKATTCREARGGNGTDLVTGQGTADRLFGDDTIWAESGNDELRGGDGDHRLRGDAGDDVSYGSLGDDTFDGTDLFNGGSDVMAGGPGLDTHRFTGTFANFAIGGDLIVDTAGGFRLDLDGSVDPIDPLDTNNDSVIDAADALSSLVTCTSEGQTETSLQITIQNSCGSGTVTLFGITSIPASAAELV